MTLDNARAIARFVPDCALLLTRLFGDPRIPRRTKIVLGVALPYLASPVDLVPDSLPVLGQLDDALVLSVVGAYVVRTAGRDVIEELWPGSEEGLRALTSFVGDGKVPIGGRRAGRATLSRGAILAGKSNGSTRGALDDPVVRELEAISWDAPATDLELPARLAEPIVAARDARPSSTLDEPVSPELILVSSPEVAQVARLRLPDPEPLDDWLRRVRWEETERELRAYMAEAKAREERAARMREGLGAGAFAAACVISSILPVIGFLFGF